MSIESIIPILLQYRYPILFPLAVIEGPILTVVGGFLSTTGIFNPLWVYLIMVAGDVAGDFIYYMLGRYSGHALPKIGRFLGITEMRVETAKNYFGLHHKKAIVLSKLVHGIGTAGLYVAGHIRVPYGRFFVICTLTSLVQSAFFLAIGILFGHAYLQISRYLDIFGATTIVVGLTIVILLILKSRKAQP